ncbi:MAG: ring-cleaving dioxygenase [Fimbriimonadaceae bacterium]|nr:ring-cleaving dioxygenase [Fimbriimonadaceae bacterium]
MPSVTGLHHVTGICGDAQANLDFYTGVLGLRLIKLTVNFDDPGTYHLYYGDGLGRPGTVMTFFPYPDSYQGRVGSGSVASTSFAIPAASFDWWVDRLAILAVPFDLQEDRFGEKVIGLADPDGLPIELIASNSTPEPHPWANMPIPVEQAIGTIHSVTLCEEASEQTNAFLTESLGFRATTNEGARFRFEAGTGGAGTIVDVLCQPDAPHGRGGQGSIHHIAFRIPDDTQQVTIRKSLIADGRNLSPVMDRQYFHSIYFREPGGVLFEIATDGPGFTWDEPEESLGTSLKLPPHVEAMRERVERLLPPLRLP